MVFDNWLPIGLSLPNGTKAKQALFEGPGWQIIETLGDGRALLANVALTKRWITSGLLDQGAVTSFSFGNQQLYILCSPRNQVISPVSAGRAPKSKSEALAFALAVKATRLCDIDSPLQDALYIEKLSRLLPTYSISSRTDDATVLGYWLTGGASIPATSFRRLSQTLSWLEPVYLKEIVETAGIAVTEIVSAAAGTTGENAGLADNPAVARFELAGRPELEAFFNEHIVDIVQHPERYRALGIDFPSAVILHGPPGCGKTYAVQRLIDFLGWPSYEINASSVASPYIHETSKKVAQVFEEAMSHIPSVLVIDEMESFLADRADGAGHHRVEEVAEFLRRIPEAVQNHVLIIAMTNRLDMIDPAILRRGRFDHIIAVGPASEGEITALLTKLLASLPTEADIQVGPLAQALAGRPLSDVTYVVREAARLAARAGQTSLGLGHLHTALRASPARRADTASTARIGFV